MFDDHQTFRVTFYVVWQCFPVWHDVVRQFNSMLVNSMRSLMRSGCFRLPWLHNDETRQAGSSNRGRGALIFIFKHFHVNLCVSYGKLFHKVKQAHLLLFHSYCLTLPDLFIFSSSSFRPSNSKTATTAFRLTSIQALIFAPIISSDSNNKM